MTSVPFKHSHLGLIAISGPDAEKFLQGQLTCDVRDVNEQQSRLGAYCNHQGRVQATFRLFQHDGSYYLLLPVSMVSTTLALLQKYALFSKVTLTEATQNLTITDIPGDNPEKRIVLNIDTAVWELNHILAGIPTIYPETVGLFTPHMLNYDRFGVSFNKGCYMGQEVVARTQYLGKAKQHMYLAQCSTTPPPTPGDAILTNEQLQAGTVVNIAPDSQGHSQLLVVLKDTLAKDVIFEKIESC
jgi:folate-binding protein YgfZ